MYTRCAGDTTSNPHELRPRGRWDRNRIGALRLWITLPSVQQRPGIYTSTLEIIYVEGPSIRTFTRATGVGVNSGVRSEQTSDLVLVRDSLWEQMHLN